MQARQYRYGSQNYGGYYNQYSQYANSRMDTEDNLDMMKMVGTALDKFDDTKEADSKRRVNDYYY